MNTLQELQIEGTRFGAVSYSDRDILRFPQGLVGFEACQHFLLVSTMEQGSFRWLQSLEYPELAFLVTDPAQFIQNYAPPVDAPGKNPPADRLLLTTVNIPRGRPEEMSLNLAGPIVIDLASKIGRQIVLEDEAYTTRYRVFAKASQEDGDVAA